jgi:hypothetical protein
MAAPRSSSSKRKCPCGRGLVIEHHTEINPNSDYSSDDYHYVIECAKCEAEWHINSPSGNMRSKLDPKITTSYDKLQHE